MDPPISSKYYTRSSSDESSRVASRGDFSYSVQEISHSLDSWKERRKLGLTSRGQRDPSRGGHVNTYLGPARQNIARTVSNDPASAGETPGEMEGRESKRAQKGEDENVPSTVGRDKSALGSYTGSNNRRSCSNSSISSISSSDASTNTTRPAFFTSSQRYHRQHDNDNDGEKAEETKATEKRESVVKQTTITELRSSQTNIPTTDKSRIVSQPGVEPSCRSSSSSSSLSSPSSPPCSPPSSPPSFLPSSSSSSSSIFHHHHHPHRPASPLSGRPPSLLSKRSAFTATTAATPTELLSSSTASVASSSRDGDDDGDSVPCRDEDDGGAERRRALHSSCGKRTSTGDVTLGSEDAQRNAEHDCVVRHSVDDRSNSKAVIGSEDTTDSHKKDSSARDANVDIETPGNNTNDRQKNFMTHNLENDEMWDVDLTAIEATQTLNNENARQKLLLRRKSSLAQRQRPTRTRKRFSDSESESKLSSLHVESVTYEKKKTRGIYHADLPETTDEYTSTSGTSSKVQTEPSENPFQHVLKERKDPGLQLKKEKDQENRAVLDTTPVVLRKNSYNNFDNIAGSRKPLIQEISYDDKKVDIPEKVTPFGNVATRSPRHHELLRASVPISSSENPADKTDPSPTQVGSEIYRNRLKKSVSYKETNRKSCPNVDFQPFILRSASRKIFEDGPKTTVNTEDDWLNKRRSTPIITNTSTAVSIKDSSTRSDSNSDEQPDKWSVIRQPLDSGTDNRNTQNVTERPAWIKKNLDQRRTCSYSFTPPPAAKELDSKEPNEAPWIKEFRNSRKRVGRILSNREPLKPGSDKPQSSSFEATTPVRIAKPLSSLVGEQSSREVGGRKLSLNTSPCSTVVEKKETPNILPDVSASPKYKVERKFSFQSTNEGGVSSRMKENRSPVTQTSINTAEPYLPSWSVADAGEAPASLADTRGDIPDWQRKLAEKNKLRKQSFRRIEDSSSSKGITDDGSPKAAQPAWRHQLKNRTPSSVVEQGEKKSADKPDWIKQAEERRARLAQNKLLGE